MSKLKVLREEFTSATKKIIAARSGYKCSYPDCNKTLIGPGDYNNKFSVIGQYAHIFSAKPGGPRGDGGLKKELLGRPENGIFLCANHHKIVDDKSSVSYPADVLIRFKSRHEFFISAQLGEYLYPLNWINKIKIVNSTIFNHPIEINLGKLTHLYGDYASGKTTIAELIYSCFQQKIDNRWKDVDNIFEMEICIDNPIMKNFVMRVMKGMLSYKIGGTYNSFVPYDYFVIFLKNDWKQKADHISLIADCFNLERNLLKSFLINEKFIGITIRNYSIKEIRTKPYPVDQLFLDVGKGEQQNFSTCSSSEKGRVLLDIAMALASKISAYKSVLLIIDWVNIYSINTQSFRPYLNYLLSPKAHFQSIFVSSEPMDALDWNGWEIAQFQGQAPDTKIIQNSLK